MHLGCGRAPRHSRGLPQLRNGDMIRFRRFRTEIRTNVQTEPAGKLFQQHATANLTGTIMQIVLLDLMFSVDSILTAV